MDSSAFRHLSVGKIMLFAIVGWIATVVTGVAGLLFLFWWLFHHIQIV